MRALLKFSLKEDRYKRIAYLILSALDREPTPATPKPVAEPVAKPVATDQPLAADKRNNGPPSDGDSSTWASP